MHYAAMEELDRHLHIIGYRYRGICCGWLQ